MEKTIMVGKLMKLDTGITQAGKQYFNGLIGWPFIKNDGTTAWIKRYFSAFNDYAIKQLSNVAVGSLLYVEGNYNHNEVMGSDGVMRNNTSFVGFKFDVLFLNNQQQVQQPNQQQNQQAFYYQQQQQQQQIQQQVNTAPPLAPNDNADDITIPDDGASWELDL